MAPAARPQLHRRSPARAIRPTSRGSAGWRWVTFAHLHPVLRRSPWRCRSASCCSSSFFKFFGFYQLRHADARALPQRLGEPRVLARLRQHHAARACSAPRRPWCSAASSPTSPSRTQLARPPADRRARLAALDDAGHGAGHRLPVGLRHAAARHPDLRHDVGAAAGLYRARHAGRGARDVGRLCSSSPSTSRSARACTARAGGRRCGAS